MGCLCFGSSSSSTTVESQKPKPVSNSNKRMSVLSAFKSSTIPSSLDKAGATSSSSAAAATKNKDSKNDMTKDATAASVASTGVTAAETSGEEPKAGEFKEAEAHKQDPRILNLIKEVEPIRVKLVDHKVYGMVDSVERLQTFMKSHIFAVWDFMSLLKYLQRELTCIEIPWIPVGDPRTRYLINEIVTDEECDIDENNVRMSHFELYLQSMKSAGASTEQIEQFIVAITEKFKAKTANVKPSEITKAALDDVSAKQYVKDFVGATFDVIDLDKLHVAAAVFTFGREDLIPSMFISFVRQLYKQAPEKFARFKYYLERHIEVDGDHHAILAHEMTALLCGDDEKKWEEAIAAVKKTLQARVDLWDGIQKDFESEKSN